MTKKAKSMPPKFTSGSELNAETESAVAETSLNQYAIELHEQLSQSNGFLFVGIGVQEGKPVFIVYVDQRYKNRFLLNITAWQKVPIVVSFIQQPRPATAE